MFRPPPPVRTTEGLSPDSVPTTTHPSTEGSLGNPVSSLLGVPTGRRRPRETGGNLRSRFPSPSVPLVNVFTRLSDLFLPKNKNQTRAAQPLSSVSLLLTLNSLFYKWFLGSLLRPHDGFKTLGT